MKKLSLVVLSLVLFALSGATFLYSSRDYSAIRQVSYGIGAQDEIFCSATKISENQLLTAAHCIPATQEGEPAFVFLVFDQNVKNSVGKAVAEKVNITKDLTLLKIIEGVEGPAAVLASQEPSQDDRVWVVGYSLGEVETVTEGLFLSFSCKPDIGCFYFHSAPTTFVNSGGSLWVYAGWSYKLIGIPNRITSQGYGPYNHLGLAVTLKDIKEFLGESNEKDE